MARTLDKMTVVMQQFKGKDVIVKNDLVRLISEVFGMSAPTINHYLRWFTQQGYITPVGGLTQVHYKVNQDSVKKWLYYKTGEGEKPI